MEGGDGDKRPICTLTQQTNIQKFWKFIPSVIKLAKTRQCMTTI